MKKYLVLLGLVSGLCAVSQASVITPKDSVGRSLDTINFVGADSCVIANSTGTAAVQCFTGQGFVLGAIVSGDVNANYALLRDTNTANLTSAPFANIYQQGNGAAQAVPGTVMQMFPVPVKFTNGLSVNTNLTPPATVGIWTIIYRRKSAVE